MRRALGKRRIGGSLASGPSRSWRAMMTAIYKALGWFRMHWDIGLLVIRFGLRE
jgi:hypothetical protein